MPQEFSTFNIVTPLQNSENNLKFVVFQLSILQQLLSNILKVSAALSPNFEATYDSETLFFQVCRFLRTPKSPRELNTHKLKKTITQKSHVKLPYSK